MRFDVNIIGLHVNHVGWYEIHVGQRVGVLISLLKSVVMPFVGKGNKDGGRNQFHVSNGFGG